MYWLIIYFLLHNLPALSALMESQTLQLKSSYPANKSRPDLENATEVMPQMMLSWLYMANSWSARMSKSRQVASSDPVAKAHPFGKKVTALMSDSWPGKVCLHTPSRMSHSCKCVTSCTLFARYFKREADGRMLGVLRLPLPKHRRPPRRRSGSLARGRATSHRLCGRKTTGSAGPSLCPIGHWNKMILL